jgi:hypothetical protein
MLDGLSAVNAIWSFESIILAGTLSEEGRKALAGHAAINKVAVNEYLMVALTRLRKIIGTNWFDNQVYLCK